MDAHANASNGDTTIALSEHCLGELKRESLEWILCNGIA